MFSNMTRLPLVILLACSWGYVGGDSSLFAEEPKPELSSTGRGYFIPKYKDIGAGSQAYFGKAVKTGWIGMGHVAESYATNRYEAIFLILSHKSNVDNLKAGLRDNEVWVTIGKKTYKYDPGVVLIIPEDGEPKKIDHVWKVPGDYDGTSNAVDKQFERIVSQMHRLKSPKDEDKTKDIK